jgi:nucleoside-diphosphate-sugar epimerase
MEKILLLGRNGFIGKHLYDSLIDKYDVIDVTDKKQKNRIKDISPDYVVNLCASSPNANFNDSFDANIFYPLGILKKLLINRKNTLKWIQIGSYFELQIEFGRNDYYTLHKNTFKKFITDLEISNKLLSTHTIILPHITGPGELESRLFPTMRRFNKDNTGGKKFSNGNQFLPVLSVSDACIAISKFLVSNQKFSSAQPVLHLRVREIIGKCVINADQVIFDKDLNPLDSNYPMVTFPENVIGFKPNLDANVLINSTRRAD